MSDTVTKPFDAYRLPTDVHPKHYDLTVRTDLENETFEGVVGIECVSCLYINLVATDASVQSRGCPTDGFDRLKRCPVKCFLSYL